MRGTFFHFVGLIVCLTIFLNNFATPVKAQTGGKSTSENVSNCVEGDLPPDAVKLDRLTEAEDKFCAEISRNPDLQAIYGFVISSRIAQIVRVYRDKAVLTYYEDDARFKERVLSRTETAALRKRLDADKPESQQPLRDFKRCTDMCLGYEFLSINRDGGRRVYMFAPRYHPPAPMNSLAQLFQALTEAGNFQTRYYLQDENKDFQILFADDVWDAQAVWKNGDDWRILVNDPRQWYADLSASTGNSEKNFPAESYQQRVANAKRSEEIEYANYFWHKFKDGKLAEKVSPPAAVPFFEKNRLQTAKDFRIDTVCKNRNQCALIKIDAFGKSHVIKEGDYESAVVSPDGRWAIAVRKDKESSWDNLVRINLESNAEYPVDLETSYSFDVIGYVAAHQRFLVRQRKFTGYQKPYAFAFFLLDGETGRLKKVEGDFDWLTGQRYKPLQPTQKANVFWAARHDFKGTTEFGLYDTKIFAFKLLAKWSGIEFQSDKMWVDEQEKKIFFVYQGHLLSLPLPRAP